MSDRTIEEKQVGRLNGTFWRNLALLTYSAAALAAGILVAWKLYWPLGVTGLALALGAVVGARFIERRREREHAWDKSDLSYKDELTGLPNRRLFLKELRECLSLPLESGKYTALFFIDLDHLKGINDALGHVIGDLFLQEMSARLRQCLGARGTLARFGGDEFTYLLNDVESRQGVILVAQEIMKQFDRELEVRGHEIWASTSMGIVMVGMPRPGADDLLSMADAALYNAKQQGRGQYVLFEPNLPRPTPRSISLDAEMRAALVRDQMVLHYQPIVSLARMEMTGLEALIRWNHPLHGLLSPNEFINLAEESGMIKAIGAWVIESASERISAWQELYGGSLTMGVNLSALQLRQSDLLTEIAATTKKCGLQPGSLQLEITERNLLQDDERTLEALAELRRAGFRIAIDDFGVGYSSLSYLQRFEVDTLKLDQSFIAKLTRRGEALVMGIIQLGHSLGMNVLAEGIEDHEQLEFLLAAGCDEGQGFLLGRPMDEKSLIQQLTSRGTQIVLPRALKGEEPELAPSRLIGTAGELAPRPVGSR